MVSDDTTIARRETALSNKIEDRVLMMDIDSGAYYELDGTAARIWELTEEPRSFADLCKELSKEYDVDAEECRVDTSAFVEDLEQKGLVSISR